MRVSSVLVHFGLDIDTHIRKPAVTARHDLRLVRVDEDARMPGRTTASVARNDTFVRPPDRLLVNELYRGVGLGLDCRRDEER